MIAFSRVTLPLSIPIAFLACADGDIPLGLSGTTGDSPASYSAAVPFVTDLIAGRHLDAGDVLVWNDDAMLYVRYNVEVDDLCLHQTHLHVATSLEHIPQTRKGNPIPGHFQRKTIHDCLGEFTYEFDLVWEPGTELFLAAHADVSNGEGAWAAGDDFPGQNWATYFTFTIPDPPPAELPSIGPAVRHRSFANTDADEIFLGAGTLDEDGRVAENFGTERSWAAQNEITFSYEPGDPGDATDDRLISEVVLDPAGSAQTVTLEFTDYLTNLADHTSCTLESLNTLVFELMAGDDGTTVLLNNVFYNGIEIGALSGPLEIAEGDLGVDFGSAFSITGTLELSGSFGSDPDASFVAIHMTCPSGT